jgi:GTPase SAR1 family protein
MSVLDPDPDLARGVAVAASDVADEAGLSDLARRLRGNAHGTEGPTRVVCVGTQKVGKSSLVNALVGRSLLSPVGDDVVTATYLVVGAGERDEAAAVLVDRETGRLSRVEIDLSELADYVSVDAVHDGVVRAEVRLASPQLAAMQLVDTPGVGGLESGHTAVTMASLDTAHALLFVIDPGAPLSVPELSFLREASRRVRDVILVMTKVDLHPEWRSVRDDDLALVSQHVPELAGLPIVPVSSRLAVQAQRLGRADVAAGQRLQEASGVAAVLEEIRVQSAANSVIRSDRRLDDLRALLTELRAWTVERPENLAQDPAELAAVKAERDRIRDFLFDPHNGSLEIHKRLQRLRRDRQRDFTQLTSTLLDKYGSMIDTAPAGEIRQIPTLLQGEIGRALVDVIGTVDSEVAAILEALESRIGSSEVLRSVRADVGTDVSAEVLDYDDRGDWGRHLLSAAETTVAASGTLLLAGVLTGGGAWIALGAAAVVTVGLRQVLTSREANRQQSIRLWIDRARRDVDRSFDHACGARLDRLERALDVGLPRLLEARIARIDELTAAVHATPGRLTGPDVQEVDALIARLDRARTTKGRPSDAHR